MFGLMKYYRCASSQKERDHYRQHYCGVCKILGKLYGQHTRFLLNRDLVFLSEVLTELSHKPFPSEATWNRPLSRIDNCLKLPIRHDEIPLSLHIAANYNVLMSRFKLEDNIADTRRMASFLWKILGCGFSRAFKTSSQQAGVWGYPLEEVRWWMEEQRRREADRHPPEDATQALRFFAEPSAHTSGLSMKQAALIIERPDKADRMYELGYRFGTLIYILDALEDLDEDDEKHQFNALRAAYRHVGKDLPAATLQEIRALCRSLEHDTQEAISALQLSERAEAEFKKRLTRNLKRKLDREACLPRATCEHAGQRIEKMKLREKWRYATELSHRLAFSQTGGSRVSATRASLSFLAFFTCIFSTPQQVLGYVTTQLETSAASSPDCLNTVFWLSWLSLAAGAAFRRPKIMRLTAKSFEKLKEDGVPDEILAPLEELKGREFADRDEFLQAIHTRIGEQTVPYQSKFLQHAALPRRKAQNDVDGGGETSEQCSFCDCCYCGDCCDCADCCSCGRISEGCESGAGGADAGSACDCGGAEGCDCGSCIECGSCGDACNGCDACSACDCGGCDCGC